MTSIHSSILVASLGFMGLLTFTALMVMFRRRVGALKSKVIRVSQFKTYETEGSMPASIVQASRHYANLFELPTLFYVIVLFAFVTQAADLATSILCLGFCAFRAAHALVHLGSNNVFHRMRFFAGSVFALAGLWIYVIGKYFL